MSDHAHNYKQTAFATTQCQWCSTVIARGMTKIPTSRKEFNKPYRCLLTLVSIAKKLPIGISCHIATFIFGTPTTDSVDSYCLSCSNHNIYITRSGRVSKCPRSGDIDTIPGSGISGCDQYDRSFDGMIAPYTHNVYPDIYQNLPDFIVDDDDDDIIVHFDREDSEIEQEYIDSESDYETDSEMERLMYSSSDDE